MEAADDDHSLGRYSAGNCPCQQRSRQKCQGCDQQQHMLFLSDIYSNQIFDDQPADNLTNDRFRNHAPA